MMDENAQTHLVRKTYMCKCQYHIFPSYLVIIIKD